jgi:hypothetical protein
MAEGLKPYEGQSEFPEENPENSQLLENQVNQELNEQDTGEIAFQKLKGKLLSQIVDFATTNEDGQFYLSPITDEGTLASFIDGITDEQSLMVQKIRAINTDFANIRIIPSVFKSKIPVIKELLASFPDSEIESLLDVEPEDLSEEKAAKDVWHRFYRWEKSISKQVSSEIINGLDITDANDPKMFALLLVNFKNDLRRIENQCKEFYQFIEEKRLELQGIDGANERTTELSDEVLVKNLTFRESLFEKILEDGINVSDRQMVMHRFIAQTQQPDEFIGNDLLNPFDEYELVYSGIVLSPNNSTRDFFEQFSRIYHALPENLPSIPSINFILANTETRKGVFMSFTKILQKSNSMAENIVMEIGGNDAADAFMKMGADSQEKVDAGHSGYTMGYSAGPREEMIELSNYSQYGTPHSVDLICSSRLFDTGSGIGEIAETDNILKRDRLGEEEMALVMTNLLKDNGFMIHYDGNPPKDIQTLAGINEIYTPKSYATIFRFHEDRVQSNRHDIGRKTAVYNQETQTWELAK